MQVGQSSPAMGGLSFAPVYREAGSGAQSTPVSPAASGGRISAAGRAALGFLRRVGQAIVDARMAQAERQIALECSLRFRDGLPMLGREPDASRK